MAEEIVPPEVLGFTIQPSSGGEIPKHQPTSGPNAAQKIGFYAYRKNEYVSFTVLAGEGAPTVTGGWVKIAKVQRFQRISVTVPEGYDPRVLTVPIMFDATLGDRSKGGKYIEENIKRLEWMAGRPTHHAGELTGEPPYVQVYSLTASNNPTALVPRQFQALNAPESRARDTSEVWKAILAVNPKLGNNPEKKLKTGTKVKYPLSIVNLVPSEELPLWYITGIAFDTNPLRNSDGNRIRQSATVELTEIVLSPTAQVRAESESEANSKKLGTFTVTNTVDRITKIAKELTKGRA